VNWRTAAYRGLALSNDYRAARHGRVGRRIARRIVGRATGRLMGRIFG
jgi:phage protein U